MFINRQIVDTDDGKVAVKFRIVDVVEKTVLTINEGSLTWSPLEVRGIRVNFPKLRRKVYFTKFTVIVYVNQGL